MCEILDLNPRLNANQATHDALSELFSDHVCSDKALARINRDLRMLDEKMIKAEHVALYGEEGERSV